ncbi:MAG: hypothetical protein NTW85_12850 [Methylococcales bacterium]|nr:hypothetical protein [Methylococcales bacterium]
MDNAIEHCINSEEELLLYTLFSLKSSLTYDVLELVCGMGKSNAKRNQGIGLEILSNTLTTMDGMLKRNFLNVNDFECFYG